MGAGREGEEDEEGERYTDRILETSGVFGCTNRVAVDPHTILRNVIYY